MSLINVEKISVADQQHYPDSLFPLVYASQSNTDSNAVARWIQQHKSKIEAELETNGAVLFRGFGVVDDQALMDLFAPLVGPVLPMKNRCPMPCGITGRN